MKIARNILPIILLIVSCTSNEKVNEEQLVLFEGTYYLNDFSSDTLLFQSELIQPEKKHKSKWRCTVWEVKKDFISQNYDVIGFSYFMGKDRCHYRLKSDTLYLTYETRTRGIVYSEKYLVLKSNKDSLELIRLDDNEAPPEFVNALDTILGDKYIDNSTTNFRPNNFQSLTEIPVFYLLKQSKIYNIKKIDDGLFLLQQKKSYTGARLFNILLTVDNDTIKDYFVLNDFKISDYRYCKNELLLLCSNLDNTNVHWNTKNEVKILKINSSLEEIWTYSAKDNTFMLDATELKVEDEKIFALVHAIRASHISYNIIEVEIDNNGKCQNANEIGKVNISETLSQETVNSIFMNAN